MYPFPFHSPRPQLSIAPPRRIDREICSAIAVPSMAGRMRRRSSGNQSIESRPSSASVSAPTARVTAAKLCHDHPASSGWRYGGPGRGDQFRREVAGYSVVNGNGEATVWQGGMAIDLGEGVADAINDAGIAAGYVNDGFPQATTWPGGSLGTLPAMTPVSRLGSTMTGPWSGWRSCWPIPISRRDSRGRLGPA